MLSVTINSNAIANSSNLKDIFGKQVTEYIIGNSVTSIREGAFNGCEALKTINYAGTKKQWKKIKNTKLTLEPKKQIIVICSDGEIKLKGK